MHILTSLCPYHGVRISLALKLAQLLFALTTKAVVVAAGCRVSIVEGNGAGVLLCRLAFGLLIIPVFIVFLSHRESLAFLSDLISLLHDCRDMVTRHHRVTTGVSKSAVASLRLLEEV